MITFQTIIDEARRQKNKLALDFYNLLKEEYEHDSFDLVAYFKDEDLETAVGFCVSATSCSINNIKLATITTENFNEVDGLSFKNVLTLLEEQLDDFEKTLNKKMKVDIEPNFIEFEYKGFWVESESFDQAENGHAEDGITYTSSVWHSKEERDALEDEIEILREVFDSPEELEVETKKKIDKYIKQQKRRRNK